MQFRHPNLDILVSPRHRFYCIATETKTCHFHLHVDANELLYLNYICITTLMCTLSICTQGTVWLYMQDYYHGDQTTATQYFFSYIFFLEITIMQF